MGLLKKIFKPVSKVLDKIIPNELKPILPYAAAFAPYLGPMQGIMGIGGNSMLTRALMSGALNIGGQLAQEGSEGDINLLSAGLGALQGAMTAPGAADKFKAMQISGRAPDGSLMRAGSLPGDLEAADKLMLSSDIGMLGKAQNVGLDALAKGSGWIEKGMAGDFVDKAKVLTIPAAQATGDVLYAQGQRDLNDLANQVVEDMGGGYTDAAYRAAIRKSMEAYDATEEEILAAIEAAGYRSGGRVGFQNAGLASLNPQQSMKEEETQWISRSSPTKEVDMINKIYEEGGHEALQAYLERNPDLTDKYIINADAMSGELSIVPNKLHPDNMDMENIIMIGDGKGGTIDMSTMFEENKAKGGRVGFEFGGIGEAIEKVEDKQMKETLKLAQDMDMPIEDLVEEFIIIHKRKPNSLEELKMFYKDKYKWKGPADVKMQETMTERFTAKDGGAPSVLPKGIEADYRGGGFIPIGSRERADDVPARLSENEFVMTADAVRAAGGGSVNEGAKRMYNLMHNLEARA